MQEHRVVGEATMITKRSVVEDEAMVADVDEDMAAEEPTTMIMQR